jgi:DNA-3-methyladenine glycosylase II
MHIRKVGNMMIETYNKYHPYVKHLLKKDPHFKSVVNLIDRIEVPINDQYYEALVEMIIAQQLSSKVASILNQRLRNFLMHQVEPQAILLIEDEQFRLLGLSKQKMQYLRNLSIYYLANIDTFSNLKNLSDEEVIMELVKIKGIGRWTSEMFLIFSLGRHDVFSVLDLGLREAVKKLYQNPNLKNEEIIEISKKWAPYRTIASHYLWHMWDNGIKA